MQIFRRSFTTLMEIRFLVLIVFELSRFVTKFVRPFGQFGLTIFRWTWKLIPELEAGQLEGNLSGRTLSLRDVQKRMQFGIGLKNKLKK